MTEETLQVLVVGAHPDDPDLKAGGIACKYTDRGHDVTFVAVADGAAGHHEQAGATLVRRRKVEMRAAAEVAGVGTRFLDVPDGEVRPTIDIREKVIRLIRECEPDLLLTHRPNDYHPDHRYTARLVQDAAYLVTVPNVCPGTPALDEDPVIAHVYDPFERPRPFDPDVVVGVDDVVERKFDTLDCHESQMYEWLPYDAGVLEEVPEDPGERRAWLRSGGLPHVEEGREIADRYRDALLDRYGPAGEDIARAEAFEASEYGSPLTGEARERLFPFP
ncbi:MAG: PIG-L deacetylase family protein [Halobacteriales archaeon]